MKIKPNKFFFDLFKYQSTTPLEKVLNILKAYIFCMVWVLLISCLYTSLFPDQGGYSDWLRPNRLILFITSVILAPLFEELMFRVLPIELLRSFSKNYKSSLFPVILGTNAIFGVLHGNYFNILIQGVVGVALSWVYIKNKSYWSAVSLHALYNLTWFLIG